ncbi:sensory transduction regulatory protein [hydrothermal vent metagenome]|uniref:Sensory transduction regulatory protein n=1 Tax=hydrothermal vent metagenome TaxID=652676 RepID=A0A1W1CG45_9ZZZZ
MIDKLKILIVEDEALIAKGIKSQLLKMGYKRVAIAINYNQAMLSIKEESPDLILLDVDLKSRHTGLDIGNNKEVLNRIPIIYITSFSDAKTLKEIMKTNPKTYLSKPLRYAELEVAVSLALKDKMIKTVNLSYGFNYDFENRKLIKNRVDVHLTKKEKLLLEALIRRKGEYVSSKILELEVWINGDMAESSLRTLVGNLRKKLKPEMIVNQPSFGYKLLLVKS